MAKAEVDDANMVVSVTDPHEVKKIAVPDNGQVYLGRDLAGLEVQVTIKVVGGAE